MKYKYLLPIFLILLIPLVIRAEETCNPDDITIESIELEEKSDSVVEISEATIEGRIIKLNVDITAVGDSAKYKIVIENKSEEDYQLDESLITANSDYVDYNLEFENKTGIVQGASKEIAYLTLEYKNEVPDSMFVDGKYSDNQAISLNLSNGEKENPPTYSDKNLLIIAAVFLAGIILFVIASKTVAIKYIVIVIFAAILIPLYVKAMCSCEIDIEANITLSQKIICKRATTLKTETCSNYDYSNNCYGAGYTSDGVMGTSTITHGSLGTPGEFHVGDAFDCDVNGDNIYDVETERFYYVTDYYDTINNTFDDSTAVLIYDANTTNGERNITTFNAYSEEGDVTNGPTEGVKHLPTTEQWPNVELKTTQRQLRTHTSETTVGEKELPVFNYENKAARLLTWQEISRGCEIGNETLNEWASMPKTCFFLFSNLAFSNRGNKAFSHWTETIANTNNVWMVYSFSRRMTDHTGNDANTRSVRPTIDVPKKNIQYR